MPRIIPGFKQFLDGNGDPLIYGLLRFTLSGTNNTDKNTYSDPSESIDSVNTNPVELDAEGRCPSVFGTGSYRVTSYISAENPQQLEQFDPMPGGSESTGEWSSWGGTTIYGIGNLVIGEDGLYYRSLANSNEGNDPTDPANDAWWEEVKLISVFNVNKAYDIDEIILFTDSKIYTCITATAAGETPVTNADKWRNGGVVFPIVGTSGAITVDLVKGPYQTLTVTAGITFTFSGWAAVGYSSVNIMLTDGDNLGATDLDGINWKLSDSSTTTTWADVVDDGVELTTSAELLIWSIDGGTTKYGAVL
jgi:hypothetical protein